MGQRHQLAVINVMNLDATIMNRVVNIKDWTVLKPVNGILADLEALGNLEKIEDHKNAVGHCYRCDTDRRTYLSKQWFVKMKPLAKPALQPCKKGD